MMLKLLCPLFVLVLFGSSYIWSQQATEGTQPIPSYNDVTELPIRAALETLARAKSYNSTILSQRPTPPEYVKAADVILSALANKELDPDKIIITRYRIEDAMKLAHSFDPEQAHKLLKPLAAYQSKWVRDAFMQSPVDIRSSDHELWLASVESAEKLLPENIAD